jgi:hypothetical protein
LLGVGVGVAQVEPQTDNKGALVVGQVARMDPLIQPQHEEEEALRLQGVRVVREVTLEQQEYSLLRDTME